MPDMIFGSYGLILPPLTVAPRTIPAIIIKLLYLILEQILMILN
jgi:hypothetical protein